MDKHVDYIKPRGFGFRHAQVFLLFLGMMIAFSMRANMSIAIVAMTDNTTTPHFEWNMYKRSVILTSFFWGYPILQIPGAELARLFGGKILYIISLSVNSIASLLMPLLAQHGWKFVCGCRALQGLAQGFIYSATHHLISQWIPVEEKGRLSTIIYAGGLLGISVQLMGAGYLASNWGWQSIFYLNGTVSGIWTLAYLYLGSDCPEKSKNISNVELLYIQRSLGRVGEQKRYPTPYRKIFTSLPFWAVIVAHCGQAWGFFTLLVQMPTYLSKILEFDIQKNGLLSSLPYLAMFLLSFPLGWMTDLIINKDWLTTSNTRKLSNTIGFWCPALTLIALSYTPKAYVTVAMILLILAVGFNSGQFTGYLLLHLDLAPNFCATLMGITNSFANIISFIAPLVCGAIVEDNKNPSEWRIAFFISAGVYFFTNLFFILFVTSEKQPWNEPVDNSNKAVVETKNVIINDLKSDTGT